MIKQAKGKVEGFKQQKAMKSANNLKDLREQRVKLEGRAKIYELEEKEKAKVKEAKTRIKKQSFTYKAVQEVKKMKTANDKKKSMTKKANTKQDYFGGQSGRNVFE
jgi:hypothetical protein